MKDLLQKVQKMGNDLSMSMDDNSNFKPGPKQSNNQYHSSGGGWGGDEYDQNGYGQNGYAHNSGGYGGGFSQGNDGRPDGDYGSQSDYAPPPGPPPGYGGQCHYSPPPGPPQGSPADYACQNDYAHPLGPPPGHQGGYTHHGGYGHSNRYGPPPSGPPQGHHGSKPNGGSRSKLGFPTKFEVWSEVAGDGETYMYIGETLKTTAYSAKMPTMSGRLALTASGRKDNRAPLGEAKDQGMSRSSALITLPNGFSCELKKNSITQVGKTTYTYTVPVDGGGKQTFEWKLGPKGLGAMFDSSGSGWKLFRQGDQTQPLAIFKDATGLGMTSKMEMGTFEFVGEGARGDLGKIWATVTVIAFLKAKQKLTEKEIIKAITSGL